jgi:hypothetical protein
MARLKLCLFALPALALAVAQLASTSKQGVQAATDAAQLEAGRAVAQVQRALAERRGTFDEAMFAIAASADVPAAVPLKKGEAVAPDAKDFEALRTAIRAHLPESMRDAAQIVWADDRGTLGAVGSAEPADGNFNFPTTGAGTVALAGGTPSLVASFSPHPKATVIVAVPAFDAQMLDGSLPAIALVTGGKVLMSAGAESAAFAQALASEKPGIVLRGAAGQALGVTLPTFAGELSGAQAPLAVLERASAGPIEIAAIARPAKTIEAIAGAQRSGLLWAGCLGVLFVIVLVVSGEKRAKAADVEPVAAGDEPPTTRAPIDSNLTQAVTVKSAIESNPTQALTVARSFEAAPQPLPVAESAASEASPDDFQFGTPAKGTQVAPPSSSEGIGSAEPSSLPISTEPVKEELANPSQLLQQAAIPLDADEQHFQEVFREYVSIRTRCGEAAVTFEKFAPTLRKKRDELTGKGGIRSVRFQAYEKDGKAAIRATAKKE